MKRFDSVEVGREGYDIKTLRAEHISGTRLNILGFDQAADDNACIRTLYFLGGLVCNVCSSVRNNVSILTHTTSNLRHL